MLSYKLLFVIYLSSAAVFAQSNSDLNLTASCTINQYSQVATVLNQCSNIIIDNLRVPANQAVELKLKDGATLTFRGTTIFEVGSLDGWLLTISGNRITVKGETGSLIHGNGEYYWDGQGGAGGKTKPKLLYIYDVTDAVFENIYLKNCPMFCTGINKATNLKIDGWVADCADGDNAAHLGRNTDGIGISWSKNIHINNAYIHNQDQCLYVNQGSDMYFTGIHCVNSNGICVTAGFSDTSIEENTSKNITFHNCIVEGGLTGVQLIAMAKPGGGPGTIRDVTFQNVYLKDIRQQGIYVQMDFGDPGHPNNNLAVTNIEMSHIYGTVKEQAKAVYIVCGSKCSNFLFSNIDITGSKVQNSCNYEPQGFQC